MKIALNTIVTKSTSSIGISSKGTVNDKTIQRNAIIVDTATVEGKKSADSNIGKSNTNGKGVALLATAAAAAVLKGSKNRNVFSFTSPTAGNIKLAGTSAVATHISTTLSKIPSNNNNILSSNATANNSNSIISTTVTNSISNPVATAAATSTTTTAVVPSTVSNKLQHLLIPSDILDDLASRFIINVPDVERTNLIRICFQIELAHWFYLDFFCAIEEKKLQPCGIKQFAMQLFQHIPFLRKHLSTIDKILDDWKNYKLAVPTYGAILISQDLNYVLLVQSYWAKSSWGFPKGKVNENEEPEHCATREVYEETGYDITGLIVPNDYIEAVINYQYTRLYIVRNVSLETLFSPRTRNEIKCCDWFPIDSLPINKNDAISKTNLGINANSFFMIMPFVKRLKKWVNDIRSGIETRHKFSSSSSPIMTFNNGNGSNCCGIGQKNNNNNNTSSCKKDEKKDSALINNNNHNNNNSKNNNNTTNNNNKRQRHKSMGDLDGIKLNVSNNNDNNNNTNSASCNVKSSSGGTKYSSISTPSSSLSSSTAPSSSASLSSSTTKTTTIVTTVSTKLETTSSPSSFLNQITTPNDGNIVKNIMTSGAGKRTDKQNHLKATNTTNISTTGGGGSSSNGYPKRQLFHSHSQNGTSNNSTSANQCVDDLMALMGVGNNSVTTMSSFDLIRKEKQYQQYQLQQQQQQKVGNFNETKINKAQSKGGSVGNGGITAANGNNGGGGNNHNRTRAKSQSSSSNNNQQQHTTTAATINNKQMQNAQQQTIMATTVATATAAAIITQKAANPTNDKQSTISQRQIKHQQQQPATAAAAAAGRGSGKLLSSPPLSCPGLLVVSTTTAAATKPESPAVNLSQQRQQQQQQQQSNLKIINSSAHHHHTQKIQRMLSATNLKLDSSGPSSSPIGLLKSASAAGGVGSTRTNYNHQHHHHHTATAAATEQLLKFNPNFDSWTNFSFTKNFIANVFC